jgi:hypothetical protein
MSGNNKNVKPQSVLETPTETTEQYYDGVVTTMKVLIETQRNEIHDHMQKNLLLEKAIALQHEEAKKKLRDKESEVKMLEQEMSHYRDKDEKKVSNRTNVRKMVQELHEIKNKKRERLLAGAELDDAAKEFLKKYSL